MKEIQYILIFISIFSFSNLSAQNFKEQRKLRLRIESNDTIQVKVKKDKLGQIIQLSQEHYIFINGETYLIEEEYKKDKYWNLWQYKEVEISSNKVKFIPDGKQFHFDNAGRIIGIQQYIMGKRLEINTEFDYYSNGKIRFIAEVKDNRYWNFVLYRYPDGKEFSFGNFKDGNGDFIMLDDNGKPCRDCTVINAKINSSKIDSDYKR